MSWVRIRLSGSISGHRLTQIGQEVSVRRVRLLRGGAEMEVRARDVKCLRHILRGAGLRMRVLERHGVLRARLWARRRKGVIASLLCAALVLWGLGQTVFEVRVVGAKDEVQKQLMLELLEDSGIRRGVYAGNLDGDEVCRTVLAKFSGLTYAGLRRRGLAVELYVVQASPAPKVYDPMEPVDVVAVCGGLVTRVVALSGEPLVRAGDTVVKGQVLIRGTMRMPHARGAVTARIWAVGKGEAETVRRCVERTGEVRRESYLLAGNVRFPQEKATGFLQEEIEKETFDVLDGMFYPLSIERVTAFETRTTTEKRSLRLVKDESGARGLTNALTKLPNGACVVDKRIEYSMIKDRKLSATVTLECAAQIGEEQETAFPLE